MNHFRAPTPRHAARSTIVLAPFILMGCGGDSSSAPSTIVEPSLAPTSASVEIVDTELAMTTDAAISPSGNAILALDDRGWCLQTGDALECVEAEAQGSASDGILWRSDERAVAITWGRQDPMSIIDFDTGAVTETSLDDHRFLAWSPDGDDLLGLAIDVADQYSLLDPTTLEASKFADFDGPDVPRLFWISDDLIVGSSSNGPGVFVLDQNSGERQVIEGGLGEQDLRSVSADGSIAVALDDDVTHGGGDDDDPAMLLFDIAGDRSSGVMHPLGLEPNEVQLSPDGKQLLVIADNADGTALITGTIDEVSLTVPDWIELLAWERGADGEPATFVTNDLLRWNGGDTAWLITEDERLTRISLS